MVQDVLCSRFTSAENFPFLQHFVLCMLTVQQTHNRGWIIVVVVVVGSSTSVVKNKEQLCLEILADNIH